MAFFWVKIVMTIALLINFFFALFMITFPNARDVIPFTWKFLLFLFTICLFPLILTNGVFSSVQVIDGKIQITPSYGMPLFLLHTICFLGGGFFVLIRKLRRSNGIQKKQIWTVFWGAFFMFFAILLTNVFFVIFLNITSFVRLLPIYTLVFVGFTSYAIVRHKLLDLHIFLLRAFTYVFMLILIALFYAFVVVLIGKILFGVSLRPEEQVLIIAFIVFISLSFQWIKKRVQKLTARLLFKDTYDIDDAIAHITKSITSTIVLDDLSHRLIEELSSVLKPSSSALVIPEKNHYFRIFAVPKHFMSSLKKEDCECLHTESLILFDELEESDTKEYMRQHGIRLIAPCKTRDECVAYLFLGIKQSGESYMNQDIALIEIVSHEAAVAIRNAQSYEAIKKFNENLQREIEKATKELKETNNRLQELIKLKDEFVSVAAHELRTPMAAIKGSISTILEGYAGSISDEARDFLTAAYNENDRLIRIVNNLLNTSKIDSGTLSFTISRINLNILIADVLRNFEFGANEKHLRLHFESSENLPLVFGDDDKVREVLVNLVGNAIKFTSKGGVTIRCFVDGKYVVTSVSDTGTGIHKEHFDLLFKKYSQVRTDYTKTIGGTGLGLYICKKIIEGLEGEIWLESEIGKGSTFYFTLPIAT